MEGIARTARRRVVSGDPRPRRCDASLRCVPHAPRRRDPRVIRPPASRRARRRLRCDGASRGVQSPRRAVRTQPRRATTSTRPGKALRNSSSKYSCHSLGAGNLPPCRTRHRAIAELAANYLRQNATPVKGGVDVLPYGVPRDCALTRSPANDRSTGLGSGFSLEPWSVGAAGRSCRVLPDERFHCPEVPVCARHREDSVRRGGHHACVGHPVRQSLATSRHVSEPAPSRGSAQNRYGVNQCPTFGPRAARRHEPST